MMDGVHRSLLQLSSLAAQQTEQDPAQGREAMQTQQAAHINMAIVSQADRLLQVRSAASAQIILSSGGRCMGSNVQWHALQFAIQHMLHGQHDQPAVVCWLVHSCKPKYITQAPLQGPGEIVSRYCCCA